MARERVLLVDDEEHVLRGLRRMLFPMADQWEMEFAFGPEAALESLREQPVDIIVSDIRMPGMNGAQLLGFVMRRHPRTIRLALSGQSDRATIVQSVGPTHQFLAKPCEGDLLKATIERSIALRDALDNPSLQAMVAALGSVPANPIAFADFKQALRKDPPSMSAIVRAASGDPGLSSRLLQLVNSAFFGVPHRVASVAEAASLLGPETLQALLDGGLAFVAFETQHESRSLADDYWRHSRRVAELAGAIATLETTNSDVIDEARTAGLLHDLGTLLLITHMPKEYAAVRATSDHLQVAIWEAEKRELGATHGALGAYLLGIWGLPPGVVAAVAHHHEPNESPGYGFTALTAVHVAESLVRCVEDEAAEFEIDRHYLSRLGLISRLPAWGQLAATTRQTASSEEHAP